MGGYCFVTKNVITKAKEEASMISKKKTAVKRSKGGCCVWEK